MTTYTVPDIEVSYTDVDGSACLWKIKAGTVVPENETQAQILADLVAADVASAPAATTAAVKAAKSKPAAEETE